MKICGNLEKMYMNPHLVHVQDKYILRALVAACHVVVKKCSHATDVLARASSLSVFLSGKAQSKAPYAYTPGLIVN